MTFLWLAAGLSLGVAAASLGAPRDALADRLNAFIINLALPAMVLLRVPSLEVDRSAVFVAVSAWTAIGVVALAVLAIARLARWPRPITGALLLVAPLSNSAYLGIPLIGAVAGGEALPYAILYDQLGNFMALAIYGSLIVALLGGDGQRPTVASVARRIVSFPPFLAVVFALAVGPLALPAWATVSLDWLAATMGPLAMFIVGLQLEFRVAPSVRAPLAAALVLRLALAPALVWLLATRTPIAEAARSATLLQAAMPPMITAGLMGMAAGFSRPLIAAAIGVGTLAAAASLPLWFAVVG